MQLRGVASRPVTAVLCATVVLCAWPEFEPRTQQPFRKRRLRVVYVVVAAAVLSGCGDDRAQTHHDYQNYSSLNGTN